MPGRPLLEDSPLSCRTLIPMSQEMKDEIIAALPHPDVPMSRFLRILIREAIDARQKAAAASVAGTSTEAASFTADAT